MPIIVLPPFVDAIITKGATLGLVKISSVKNSITFILFLSYTNRLLSTEKYYILLIIVAIKNNKFLSNKTMSLQT